MAKLIALPLYDSRESAYVNPDHVTQITPLGTGGYDYGSGGGRCNVHTIDGKIVTVGLEAHEARNKLLSE